MKKRSLEQVLGSHVQDDYDKQYAYILELIQKGKIKPVKASPQNGKKPVLYTSYWIVEEKKDYSGYEYELLYETNPQISVDYYLQNMDTYLADREAVRQLNTFLNTKRGRLDIQVSYNERCFEIWGYEKFLSKGAGRTVLKHCGLDLHFLNCYPTAEPFAYYTASRETPQTLLILENKDPFFTIRRTMLLGKQDMLGTRVGTLIYGAGKRVLSSFQEFEISAEPYMKDKNNEILYFGDLDYEGIGIFENLASIFSEQSDIRPFVPAYLAMLEKAKASHKIPKSKEQQNQNISGVFFSFFKDETVYQMERILREGLYIPQEILNISDL